MEDGKWYGMWVMNQEDFVLAQEVLATTYGIQKKLNRPLSFYKSFGGVWVVCKKRRDSLAYNVHSEWNEHRNGPLVEVPLVMSLENE